MKLRVTILLLAFLLATLNVVAQQTNGTDGAAPALSSLSDAPAPVFTVPAAPTTLPRMAPELALQTYQGSAQHQLNALGGSSDMTVVEATIPGTGQKGRFELRRSFLAPKSLAYGAIKFVGDTFVKTNIITKLLQSEVEHVEKGEGSNTAITPANYKFSYKGVENINDVTAYRFDLKPREKRPGLFKGKIYLEATTGRILRAEGTLVKSPSVFVKKIEFTQDYEDVAGFSLPARMHSVANTRVFGKAIVDISHSGYVAHALASASDATPIVSSDQ